LVIHDDIDLPVGKIQLKLWWSSAGHNWLKDIIAVLWTKDFRRLRIWVDRPINQEYVAEYVLTPFKKEEKNLIDDKMNDIETYINTFLSS
jgi:PTH1 family peptidyl-tRNA hydrolase